MMAEWDIETENQETEDRERQKTQGYMDTDGQGHEDTAQGESTRDFGRDKNRKTATLAAKD